MSVVALWFLTAACDRRDPVRVSQNVLSGEPREWRQECSELKPYQVLGTMTPPQVRARLEPEWPPAPGGKLLKGVVIVETIIDQQGNVCDARPVHLSGREGLLAFEMAVVRAVGRWKFEPARYKGRPVSVVYTISVPFDLESVP